MKLVTIQSNITITVTSDVNKGYKDLTPEGAGEAFHGTQNVLKIQPTFKTLQIKQGQHDYPVEVAEWPSVKALIDDKLMAIVGKKDLDTSEEEVAKKKAKKQAEIDAIPQIKSLGDIAQ